MRQVYALASALCERADQGFPETREDASELIEWLRIENGHPAPRLEDVPLRIGRPRRRGGRRWAGGLEDGGDDERRASAVAAALVRDMR